MDWATARDAERIVPHVVVVAGGGVDVVLLVEIPGVIGSIARVILKRDKSQTRAARRHDAADFELKPKTRGTG